MVRSQTIWTGSQLVRDEPITHILSGNFQLPETKLAFHCPIKSLVIEPSLAGHERDLLHRLGIVDSLALVCDPNCFDALGRRIASALPAAKVVVIETPTADEATASLLMERTRHAETLIAIGSGTLNDLCKYVSHRRQAPYAVFATAPSMNGYTTATASISRRGQKLSLPAAPPVGVFFDLGVLAAAPIRLVRAGVGDSLCRSTAQLDWLLSHHLLGTAYVATPFDIQAQDETALLERIGGLIDGDLDATLALVRVLVLGGLGMLITGNSQPGSQGEHLISHYIDMFHRPHPGSLHGEQVGLATWTMASLQHEILANDVPPVLRPTIIDSASMAKRYGELGPACQAALTTKALDGEKLDRMNERLERHWPNLSRDLEAVALPLDRLRAAFDAIGIMPEPSALDIAPSFYREAVRHARELRDRFTMLDLAADADLLDPFITRHRPLFSSR